MPTTRSGITAHFGPTEQGGSDSLWSAAPKCRESDFLPRSPLGIVAAKVAILPVTVQLPVHRVIGVHLRFGLREWEAGAVFVAVVVVEGSVALVNQRLDFTLPAACWS